MTTPTQNPAPNTAPQNPAPPNHTIITAQDVVMLKDLVLELRAELGALSARVGSGGTSSTGTITATQRRDNLAKLMEKRAKDLRLGNLTADEVEILNGVPQNIRQPQQERLKAEEVGWLDPAAPEAFIGALQLLTLHYNESALVKATLKSMAANNDTTVKDWFATLHNGSNVTQNSMRSVAGWVSLIQDKFGKTPFEKVQGLQTIKFEWSKDISTFVTRNVRACMEAQIRDVPGQIYQIFERLPFEYTTGLNPNSYTTSEDFERELRGREPGARATHQAFSRQRGRERDSGTKSYPKRNATSPEYERDDRRKVTPPPGPCRDCGVLHWHTGPHAVACPPKAKEAFQKGKVKRESVLLSDQDASTESSSQYLTTSSSEDDPICITEADADKNNDAAATKFYDTEAYIVDWNTHDQLVDFNCKDYTGVYLVNSPNQTPSRKNNRVICAKALGPLPSEDSYKSFEICKILICQGDEHGEPKYRPADTGSAMNFISRKYLDKHHPNAVLVEKKGVHGSIGGIVANSRTQSTSVVVLPLFLPMSDGSDVRIESYFHVLDSFAPGLLIGMECLMPYKFRFDLPSKRYYIDSVHKSGNLLVSQEPRTFRRSVKVVETVNVPPGHKKHVAVKFDGFDSDMYFVRKTFFNSFFGEYSRGANHLVSKQTNQIRFANLGIQPIKLKKGTICGYVEKKDSSDTLVLVNLNAPALATPSSNQHYSVPQVPVVVKVPEVCNPWATVSWQKARASKVDSGDLEVDNSSFVRRLVKSFKSV